MSVVLLNGEMVQVKNALIFFPGPETGRFRPGEKYPSISCNNLLPTFDGIALPVGKVKILIYNQCCREGCCVWTATIHNGIAENRIQLEFDCEIV
jgi:hypothetical protein